MIRAGELRERVEFQRGVYTQNDSGGGDWVYNTILNTYAKVREVSPRSEVTASQDNLINLIEITIRYRPSVFLKIGDLIKWRGFTFTVAKNMKVDFLRTTITIQATSEMETSQRG